MNNQNQDLQITNAFAAVSQAEASFREVAGAFGKLAFKAEAEYARQLLSDSLLVAPNKAKYALYNCAPESIYNAVAQVSSVGLSLNPKLGHAYLVPRFNSQTGRLECSLDFGYKGLIRLGVEAKAITHVTVESIFPWDVAEGNFKWNGPSQEPCFKGIDPFDPRREQVMSAGVICISHLVTGGVTVTRMSRKELDEIRESTYSPAYKKWREQMEFKSVIKRAYKLWPMDSTDERIHNAISILNNIGTNYSAISTDNEQPKQASQQEEPAPVEIKQHPTALLTQTLLAIQH